MKQENWVGLIVAAALLGPSGAQSQEADVGDPGTLPEGIVWETNNDDPLIGSPDAIRGGAFNYMLVSYPLTFRLMGPNANNSFVLSNSAMRSLRPLNPPLILFVTILTSSISASAFTLFDSQ